MPYIKMEERERFDSVLRELPAIRTKGELEYCLFFLMQGYKLDHDFTYTHLHDCTYAAMHCADEFRRRFLDKRENEAREANGDIIV